MITLNLMGAATFLVGLIPGYATIGIAAPIILVLLRLLQGLSASSKQARSDSLSLEHTPDGKRGLYTSWTMQGTALGSLLASVVFMLVSSMEQSALLFMGLAHSVPHFRAPYADQPVHPQGVDETDTFLETKEARNDAQGSRCRGIPQALALGAPCDGLQLPCRGWQHPERLPARLRHRHCQDPCRT